MPGPDDLIRELQENYGKWPPEDFLDEVDLTVRERAILWLRHECGLSQEEAGKMLIPNRTLSQQLISKIERMALAKIRRSAAPSLPPTKPNPAPSARRGASRRSTPTSSWAWHGKRGARS